MINIATIDYSKLKREYVSGNISYRELAKKHGVPFGTLRKVAAKEQWASLRTQARAKTDTKLVDTISDKNANRACKIIDVADKLLDKISKTVDAMDVIDSQSLKHFTSALKDLKEIKGFKSDADMREQEARIAKLEKEATATEDTTKEITITIEGGDSSWAG